MKPHTQPRDRSDMCALRCALSFVTNRPVVATHIDDIVVVCSVHVFSSRTLCYTLAHCNRNKIIAIHVHIDIGLIARLATRILCNDTTNILIDHSELETLHYIDIPGADL